jgi:hypothetical protein
MDVKDDNKDVKLYRASGDLLPEIRAKLPQLVWSNSSVSNPRVVRHWVLNSKVEEIIYLVSEPFSLRQPQADHSFSAQPISRMASATRPSSLRADTAIGGLVSSVHRQTQGRLFITAGMDQV